MSGRALTAASSPLPLPGGAGGAAGAARLRGSASTSITANGARENVASTTDARAASEMPRRLSAHTMVTTVALVTKRAGQLIVGWLK